jgi:ubiquinone/menaquinone biosynthesis C-methylase UbiE
MLTDNYAEDEIQALIILAELFYPVENPNNNHYKPFPKTIAEAQTYFRRFALDLSKTYKRLLNKGLLYQENGEWRLTTEGKKIADEMRLLRPPIYYFYRDFYAAIEHSQAFNTYATRVFGKNLGQHGFSDLKEIHLMMEKLELDKDSKVLDIGCGNGKITEYISDITQASVTGIDYVPEAIMLATRRTVEKRYRLNFIVGNLEMLDFPNESFDAIISIDTIFFSRDMKATLASLKSMLKPNWHMAIFYMEYKFEEFLTALKENGLSYDSYDLSRGHYEHMRLKRKIAVELLRSFEEEGNRFIWQNLMAESIGDTNRDSEGQVTGVTKRYLYIIRKV